MSKRIARVAAADVIEHDIIMRDGTEVGTVMKPPTVTSDGWVYVHIQTPVRILSSKWRTGTPISIEIEGAR